MNKILLLFFLPFILISCEKDDQDSYESLQEALDKDFIIRELLIDHSVDEFIGLEYQGGLIFYIKTLNQTLFISGLIDIHSTTDQIDGVPWCGIFPNQNIQTLTDLGTGMDNSYNIMANFSGSYTAPRLCHNYQNKGHQDWFLPSKKALELMYENLHLNGKGNFKTEKPYWSSSGNNSKAWCLFTDTGNMFSFWTNNYYYVRPIRMIEY